MRSAGGGASLITERSLWDWSQRLATKLGEAQRDLLSALAAAIASDELPAWMPLPAFSYDEWRQILRDVPYLVRSGLDPIGEPRGNVNEIAIRHTMIRSSDVRKWLRTRREHSTCDQANQDPTTPKPQRRRGRKPVERNRVEQEMRAAYKDQLDDLASTTQDSLCSEFRTSHTTIRAARRLVLNSSGIQNKSK